jgi:hypothetical protein
LSSCFQVEELAREDGGNGRGEEGTLTASGSDGKVLMSYYMKIAIIFAKNTNKTGRGTASKNAGREDKGFISRLRPILGNPPLNEVQGQN